MVLSDYYHRVYSLYYLTDSIIYMYNISYNVPGLQNNTWPLENMHVYNK